MGMESSYYEDWIDTIPDPINGMLRLNEDGSCVFFLDGEAKKGTWDVAVRIQSASLSYLYMDSSTTGAEFPLLVIQYGVRVFYLSPVVHEPETNTYIWSFLLQ